ncbi:uncharacterized protein LOC106464273 [Limulus polyphemus]|uniref:Uncharacterized protein LOC106464273 n=1 Tax=Limulus polyphemus TaxID=6850 RepID=A0ABM1BDM6_LIMPO|nr:uncharacterized protein LOC106464273 [Limulus polyphemus]
MSNCRAGFSYHVTFQGRKKVINVSSKRQVVAAIREVFGINSPEKDLQLQTFDAEWDDFVDVDTAALPDRAKLHVVLVPKAILPEQQPDRSSYSLVNNRQVSIADTSHIPCTSSQDIPETEAVSITSFETEQELSSSVPFVSSPAPSPTRTPSPTLQNTNDWREPFTIPTHFFPPCLRKALDDKLPLSRCNKGHLLEAIYQEIVRHTFYPTYTQYQEIVEKLLRAYPHLKGDMRHSEAVVYWRKTLSHKMRNRRKRMDGDIPEEVLRRRTRKWLMCNSDDGPFILPCDDNSVDVKPLHQVVTTQAINHNDY